MTRKAMLVLGVMLVAVLALALAGCGDDAETARAGLYPLEGGKWRVVGTLGYEDVEGGFYAVYDGDPEQDEGADRLAVIANGADLNAAALRGRYVEAVGTKVEVSVRQAGTEIDAETLREIDEP